MRVRRLGRVRAWRRDRRRQQARLGRAQWRRARTAEIGELSRIGLQHIRWISVIMHRFSVTPATFCGSAAAAATLAAVKGTVRQGLFV
jgi:hypothetical protein